VNQRDAAADNFLKTCFLRVVFTVAIAFPLFLLAVFATVALFLYRDCVVRTYAGKGRSLDVLTPDQARRYANIPWAAELQLKTNRLSNDAIDRKNAYQRVGVAVMCAAPSLVILRAFSYQLKDWYLASDFGLVVVEGLVCFAVFFMALLYRAPNRYHVQTRLRSEYLRSHVHCLLAKVGPYQFNSDPAGAILKDIEGLDVVGLKRRFIELEEQCARQSHEPPPTTATPLSVGEAESYVIERVGEQAGKIGKGGFFSRAGSRSLEAKRRSANVFYAAIFLACVVAFVRVFFYNYVHQEFVDFLYALCGATAALSLALRMLFNLDSKASLYFRQKERLEDLAEKLYAALGEMRIAIPGASVRFQQSAAAFESLMAREACDWHLITDRESFDVTS
jgi:hypothetical protein